MTTSRSPLRVLQGQADKIAMMLKQVERGEPINDPTGKIKASLAAGIVKIGIVMDDKVITMELNWSMIKETSEAALSAFILKFMRDQREH